MNKETSNGKGRDPIGVVLSALTKIAGSDTIARFGLKEPAEKVVFHAARGGFMAVSGAAQAVQSASDLIAPARLPRTSKPRDVFDLNPTEEQAMFQDTAQRFAADALSPAAEEADAAATTPVQLLERANSEIGLAAMAVPEELGGMGGERSPLTNALIAEQLGRGDMGLALAILAPVGVATIIAEYGSAEQQKMLLPAFVEEKPVAAALAISEPNALFDPATMSSRAARSSAGFVLRGAKSLVPLHDSAEYFLVAAELDTLGPQLFFVPRDAEGLSIEAAPSMGMRGASLGTLRFDSVQLQANALLGERPGAADFGAIVDLARIAWSALALGTAEAALDYVVEYGETRIAFGEPITNRQSVAFMMANMRIEIDGMRMMVLRAASRADNGESFHREAYLTRLFCAEKAMEVGTNAVQLLGGHGYIKDHPVERWYRNLRAIGVAEGGLIV